VELDQDLTSSKENLRSALASLQAPQFTQTSGGNSPGQGPGGLSGTPRRRSPRWQQAAVGGTLLFDAVYLASDETDEKSRPDGRHSLFFPMVMIVAAKKPLRTAIEKPRNVADTIIYSILFKDEEDHSFGGRVFGGIGGMGRPSRRPRWRTWQISSGAARGRKRRYWKQMVARKPAAGCLRFSGKTDSREDLRPD